MAPPPSEEVVDQETISLWDYLVQCGIDVDAVSAAEPLKKTQAGADADGDPNDVLLIPPLFQPSQHHDDCTNESAGSEGSMDFSAPQPVGMASESMTGAGYCVPPPVANKLDPLQMTIAPHVPDINLNLLPPESRAVPVPGNTWSGMKTPNPFELPLLARVGRKDPAFGPFILESSEVAREYPERQREAAVAAANNKRRVVGEELDAGPAAKRERRYRWPARTVTNINEKIEKLKKEAVRNPAQRRSLRVIEAEIDELQAKKDQIHARVSGQQGDGQESSHAGGGHAPPPPPPFGN